MKTKKVIVLPYDPKWKTDFENIKREIADALGDLGIKDREAFKYADKPHLQAHHLYVCPRYSKELLRHIMFRDFLRKNPEAVKKYSYVKETAARLFPDNIDKYMEYKSPYIEELYELCGLR